MIDDQTVIRYKRANDIIAPKYIIDGTTASSNGDKGGDKGGNDKGSSNGGGGDGKDDKGKDGKNGKDNSGSGLQASMAFVLMAGIITVLF